tara:strand:- start:7760 stop:7957 length:198 start_codon:yes stop_codon:yes gene_type:complete
MTTQAVDPCYTKREVAQDWLKISTRSLDRLIEKKAWPKGILVGGVPRWRHSTVVAAIDRLEQADG